MSLRCRPEEDARSLANSLNIGPGRGKLHQHSRWRQTAQREECVVLVVVILAPIRVRCAHGRKIRFEVHLMDT